MLRKTLDVAYVHSTKSPHLTAKGAWWIKIHVVASMEAIIGANSHCIKVEVGGFVQLGGDHNFVRIVVR